MKKLLVLFFALLPSIALADGANRPADDSGAPAIDNPCVRENGSSSVLSEGMAMRLPNVVVSFAINAIRVADNSGMVAPCSTDRRDNPGSSEEPAARDMRSGFDSDSSTLILGD